MSDAYTFYFVDIFPTYQDWRELIEANNIVNYQDPAEAKFDEYCYRILMRKYNHCNIRYDNTNAFCGSLLNVYENKFKQFKKEKDLIDKVYSLTEEQMLLKERAILNVANNPNTEVEDPLKPINFISSQSYNNLQSGELRGYLEALNNIPSANIFKFFKAENKYEMGFDDLFMNVQPEIIYVYEEEC